MSDTIKDAKLGHWVYRAPKAWRPFLQLARYDRPIGYWLLALPGWIGLAFASLSHGLAWVDLKWAALIFIGAIAMRGAGCTYNDIVDRDLDARVERTALRPIPAGTVSVRQAWLWLFAQCAVGLAVLLTLPRFAQIVALCSIPLVAAYPFMKRITWWPQVWLGLTFNWAVLVAYAIKAGEFHAPIFILYAGLVFWTVGYDTIYACQDIEDDAMIGVKSTARRFGKHVKLGVLIAYLICSGLLFSALFNIVGFPASYLEIVEHCGRETSYSSGISDRSKIGTFAIVIILPFLLHLIWQVFRLKPEENARNLALFKSNRVAALLLIITLLFVGNALSQTQTSRFHLDSPECMTVG